MENSQTVVLRIQTEQHSSEPNTFLFSVLLNDETITEGYVFRWDFGDGNTSEEPTPTHTYQAVKSYEVDVKVGRSGDGGKEGSDKTASTNEDEDPGIDPFLAGVIAISTDIDVTA